MAEYYPDTIEVDSSNLSVITEMWLSVTGNTLFFPIKIGTGAR
jgi:hypothetical protein